MKLCLGMIVKNESKRIERALASVAQFIDGYVVTDTGSTDDTIEKIEAFFKLHKVPGRITKAPFENWSQARNANLVAAKAYAMENKLDYVLLMDADMELVVKRATSFLDENRMGLAYNMMQKAGALQYMNTRLIHTFAAGGYRGVTHEYMDVPPAGDITDDVAYFLDHADGANRPDKFKRDIRLLRDDLKKDPGNARSMFYLANSYRDAGDPVNAAKWYERRIKAGGWDEEVWQAQGNLGCCFKDRGMEADFVRETLRAYQMRPTRAEPMYDLAKHFREKGDNAIALAFAEAAVDLPLSNDSLFVNRYVYDVGLKEEISIAAFYVPGKRMRGYKMSDELSLKAGPYGGARELSRGNLYHYIQPLKDFCPSFKWRKIDFEAPENWTAMNPSVTLHHDLLYCNVRCVNYRITENGVYAINGQGDEPANSTNPIVTRNFLLRIGADPHSPTHPQQFEVLGPRVIPCEFPAVMGFEDMRVFSWEADLWSSSTVRQMHWDGNCEQVLTRLRIGEQLYPDKEIICRHEDMHRMLRQPRATEKNWAPFIDHDELRFMHRPGHVVDINGADVSVADTGKATGHISGGSQLVPWKDGWIAVVHEARQKPGSVLRYYYHRFAEYTAHGRLKRLSLPFVFHDKEIEFCAGMCPHPISRDMVFSYGYKDQEARIATVSYDEIEEFLNA